MYRQTIEQARTRPITPRCALPSWLDLERLRKGQALYLRRRAFIQQVLGTSSLAATFAARDITPVLMQTGRLPSDFTRRMQETQEWVERLLEGFPSREAFIKNNYAQATALGELHRNVAERVTSTLKWNPRERLPMNQQAYGFVLATFAWWPLEALQAKNIPEETKDLEAWLHLWAVLGYGMGVSEALLPKTLPQTKALVESLRKAQYAHVGEPRPEGIPVLLGGQVRLIVTAMGGKPDKPTLEKLAPFATRVLLSQLMLSPGLCEALGLEKTEKEAGEQLLGFAKAGQAL